MKAVLDILPRPVVIDAFLESDVHQCFGSKGEKSIGFDVVFADNSISEAECGSASEKRASGCRTIQTDASNFEQRCHAAQLRTGVFQASDGMVLPLSAPPLNSVWEPLEPTSPPEGREEELILDAVGIKTLGPNKGDRNKGVYS